MELTKEAAIKYLQATKDCNIYLCFDYRMPDMWNLEDAEEVTRTSLPVSKTAAIKFLKHVHTYRGDHCGTRLMMINGSIFIG